MAVFGSQYQNYNSNKEFSECYDYTDENLPEN